MCAALRSAAGAVPRRGGMLLAGTGIHRHNQVS